MFLSILKIMVDASLIDALVYIVAESAPYLLFGFAAAGLLRALVPEEKVYRLLGDNSFRSVLLASLLGVPLPLCSCAVIPAAAGLRQGGAGNPATTSFLISTPETGVDSISITYALMDPIMTVARPVAAFVTALLTGVAVGLLPDEDVSPETANDQPAASCCSDTDCGDAPSVGEPARGDAVRNGLRYAFGPLLEDLAPLLVIGFVLAAVVTVIVPDGFFAAIPSGWVSSLVMMLVATPVYICASAATPIAAALVLKGLDPGAALVLLLVGPATNVTTILVVLRLMGGKVLAVYLLGVTVCALAAGVAINAIYAGLQIDASAVVAATGDTGVSAVQAIASVVLVALLAYHLWRKVSRSSGSGSETDASPVLR
jgi:uncharacterized membrane protein YraQ (UPF0718 family)